MARRREIPKRQIVPDAKYDSKLVSRFVHSIMKDGKKSKAQSILYTALALIGEKTGEPPLKIFEKAIDSIRPAIEVKSRRVGGSTYQVPTEVRPARRTALAIKWVLTFARNRSEKGMAQKLAAELMDAANQRGSAYKKKEDTHKMADANKAFAHYRW